MTRHYFALWAMRDGSRDWAGPFPSHALAGQEVPGDAAASVVTMTTALAGGERTAAQAILDGS